jgi:hypothetical protein
MNYLIIISFLLLFIQIINSFEYDDDSDEKQVASHSSKYDCLAITFYHMNIVE